MFRIHTLLIIVILGVGIFIAGCNRPQVLEYTAPKEEFPALSSIRNQLEQAEAGFDPHHHQQHNSVHDQCCPTSTIKYVTPEGWEEQPPGPIRKASFLVGSDGGAPVDISVTSFRGETGGIHANVNRWRQQIGLEALESEPLDELISRHEMENGDYLIVDLAPDDPGRGLRTIGAIKNRAEETWFFKMTGADELVAAERKAFIRFIESVVYK